MAGAKTETHVAAKAAAEEIAQARGVMKSARLLARSLNVLGRTIDREVAKLPVNQRAVLLARLNSAIAEKLQQEAGS